MKMQLVGKCIDRNMLGGCIILMFFLTENFTLIDLCHLFQFYLILVYDFFLQIGQACSPLIRRTMLWDSIMELGRSYENIMGLILFMPIGFLSWFPFVSEFQTRLLFNQAFSRGLQISRILAGQKDIGEFEFEWPVSSLLRTSLGSKPSSLFSMVVSVVYFHQVYYFYTWRYWFMGVCFASANWHVVAIRVDTW